MIPEVIFRYSNIYNIFLKTLKREKKREYPSKRKILNYIEKAERIWRKDERKILKEISRITKLEWREKYIHCYIVSEGDFSLSDPMTLLMYKKLNFLVDVLVHELIHRIFVTKKSFKKSEKAWKYIHNKYKKETWKTRIHILVHAVHNHIYLKFYSEERLKRDIKWASKHRDYKRAWDIVQKEGYHNIINEFRKRIK